MTEVAAPDGPGRLVAELDAAGALPAAFGPAFLAAAREWFVPERFWYRPDEAVADVALSRDDAPERWLAAVYADRPLVTQFDAGATVWPELGHRPTSSASAPSVVAGMLRALGPRPGDSVLEIGTGTGWNAALLAEVVGETGEVTTVEIDPEVAAGARARLRAAGYDRVEVVEGDAASAIAGARRFDRITVTAGVHIGRFPYSWVRSAVPGGVIVAPMRADLATGPLVRFVVGADGTARGNAVADLGVSFMDLRSPREVPAELDPSERDDAAAESSWTELAPWVPLLADDHRWPIAVALPGCRYAVRERTADRPGEAWLVDPLSGSWAAVVPADGRYAVRQHGPRRLWDAAEAAYRWWTGRGRPPLPAWEWTVAPDRQRVTLPPTT